MSKKIIVINDDTGENLEEIKFSGGYTITVTNFEDGGELRHIRKLDNGKLDERWWIKNYFYRPIAEKLVLKFKELKHIKPQKILFIEDMIFESKSGKVTWIAKIGKTNKHFKALTGYEYICQIRNYYVERMSKEQIVALIYHELRHINTDGELIKHDIEDWNNMIATLGTDWATTEAEIKNILEDDFDWEELRGNNRQLNMFDDKVIQLRSAQ